MQFATSKIRYISRQQRHLVFWTDDISLGESRQICVDMLHMDSAIGDKWYSKSGQRHFTPSLNAQPVTPKADRSEDGTYNGAF